MLWPIYNSDSILYNILYDLHAILCHKTKRATKWWEDYGSLSTLGFNEGFPWCGRILAKCSAVAKARSCSILRRRDKNLCQPKAQGNLETGNLHSSVSFRNSMHKNIVLFSLFNIPRWPILLTYSLIKLCLREWLCYSMPSISLKQNSS